MQTDFDRTAQGPPPLAGNDPELTAVTELTGHTLDALRSGLVRGRGPCPEGGPDKVAADLLDHWPDPLPHQGIGAREAIDALVPAFAAGSADPAHPRCVAHLHTPPLALPAATDLAVNVLNPSMDSWDQAPVSSTIEARVCRALAELVHPGASRPDALVTTGATESNLVGVLVARERVGGSSLRVLCGDNAHHSTQRATWLLGLRPPVVVPTRHGRMSPDGLRRALAASEEPSLVVATAGTTDRGRVDPLQEIADACREHGARLHVDAAYGGCALFSDRLRPALDGIGSADSVALDFHKFGGQPLAAGMLTLADPDDVDLLAVTADYLNADDDSDAGLPDLLGRSIRTSRRPDVLKLAATLLALGRTGMGDLVERCCDAADEAVSLAGAHPALRVLEEPGLSTVLFRPVLADRLGEPAGSEMVAELRRRMLASGEAVLGRATAPDPENGGAAAVWLKLTLLNPHLRRKDLRRLLDMVATAAARVERPAAA
ncbi:aminotransferase class V-fold PLP-dependent enzyme [Nocardiopsis dassonvillei]|uniref:pyridoxal phosphate-dependent decarboxylase family protein n=1 Tax=Nocardiopsis dassonvillei TaxID=2014 RepID=UPI00102BF1C4|nr:aminotransferase class V-fold PLP-dependent enzyme [Nocardiopsis dassonvillei]MCP3016388.1 aminotransferase class V-fold PLP-dependent enzyme [Nocardiopsis dassonvillei]